MIFLWFGLAGIAPAQCDCTFKVNPSVRVKRVGELLFVLSIMFDFLKFIL
ncbi:hypothetical protein [Cytobacillus purgationiresistens]|nr:hypothetical protein [Cytobacillus purgationiresistens]